VGCSHPAAVRTVRGAAPEWESVADDVGTSRVRPTRVQSLDTRLVRPTPT